MIVIGSIATMGFRSENAVVALVTKVVQQVTRKTETTDWTKAAKGDMLNGGDAVKTGDQSLAVLKFMLDNSVLRVREQSEVTLNRAVSARSVDVRKGGLGFDIRKQQENEQFRFTTPTAVASIRGTRGKLSGGKDGDTLIVVEGLVNFKNTISGRSVDVGAGSIGISEPNGSITSRKATPQELSDALSAALGSSNNQLNIELKDGKGNTRKLDIEFRK